MGMRRAVSPRPRQGHSGAHNDARAVIDMTQGHLSGHMNRGRSILADSLVDANDKMRSPSWMDELVMPVAAILKKNLGANYDMQIVPSFGAASASVTIPFTRKGIYKVDPAQLQQGDAMRMALRPTMNDLTSPLGIVWGSTRLAAWAP